MGKQDRYISSPLLLTLPSWAPVKGPCVGCRVVGANRMRLSLVQKERRALLFDQGTERCKSCSRVPTTLTGRGRGCFIGISPQGGGWRACSRAQLLGLRLHIAVPMPGATSLCTAQRLCARPAAAAAAAASALLT